MAGLTLPGELWAARPTPAGLGPQTSGRTLDSRWTRAENGAATPAHPLSRPPARHGYKEANVQGKDRVQPSRLGTEQELQDQVLDGVTVFTMALASGA